MDWTENGTNLVLWSGKSRKMPSAGAWFSESGTDAIGQIRTGLVYSKVYPWGPNQGPRTTSYRDRRVLDLMLGTWLGLLSCRTSVWYLILPFIILAMPLSIAIFLQRLQPTIQYCKPSTAAPVELMKLKAGFYLRPMKQESFRLEPWHHYFLKAPTVR